ncbi:MAG: hypothetical protein NTZ79_02370 [Proteobacteria bacterium]|nr:hypothetical protein [Pseudomonadota bacterium]
MLLAAGNFKFGEQLCVGDGLLPFGVARVEHAVESVVEVRVWLARLAAKGRYSYRSTLPGREISNVYASRVRRRLDHDQLLVADGDNPGADLQTEPSA